MTYSSPPPMIEGFTIGTQIGKGGFAKVYQATQHGLDRQVAIKVFNDVFTSPDQQRVFDRECRVMGQLSRHPGIVTVFQSTRTSVGQPAIVMELYDGNLVQRKGLSVQQVIDIGIRVSDALSIVHSHRVVHRDVKPHNIFVPFGMDGVALGDFGISSLGTDGTTTGGVGFSVNYSPPETFIDGAAGEAGDLYALGATLFQLTTGTVPFPNQPTADLRAQIARILNDPAPHLGPQYPPSLDWVIQRCLSKSPSDRPSSAAELNLELKRIQADIGTPAGPIPALSATARGSVSGPVAQAPPAGGTTIHRSPRDLGTGAGMVEPEKPSGTATGTKTPNGDPDRGRRLLIGAGLIAIMAVIGLGVGFALNQTNKSDQTRDGRGAQSTNTSDSGSTIPASNFVVLVPPDNLTVNATSATEYEIAWTNLGESLSYQVHHVESDTNELAESSPYRWTFDNPQTSACFEIRTVGETGNSVSQTASGPVCASHS